jgi:glycine dehydrogenase
VDFLPGYQIVCENGHYRKVKAPKSIGSFHRHWGNFNHKIRALTYLYRLGKAGVPRMSAVAVLASRYLFGKLRKEFDVLPEKAGDTPRMHEFILTLKKEDWALILGAGVPKTAVIGGLGKMFLDFGYYAPTVAWPEPFGLMIEPTESYSKEEMDRFVQAATKIIQLVRLDPKILQRAPHFTPIDRVDEVEANRNPVISEALSGLPGINENRKSPRQLLDLSPDQIFDLLKA